MKKVLGMVLGLTFAIAGYSFATPPQDMKLAYKLETGELTVTVTHASKGREKHYIRKYVVTVNDKSPVKFYRQMQDTPLEFEEVLDVQAKVGDVIRVKAYCVDGGSLEKEIIVNTG